VEKLKVAIHQPEHFPYMGFFQKMEYADVFIILDDVQYSKGNWQNRNRFLNKNKTDEFFTIQVEKHAYKKLINEVEVVDDNWRDKVIKKLEYNFGIDFTDLYSEKKLIDINMKSIDWVRDRLGIKTPMLLSSTLNINTKSTQRLVDIVRRFGAEYISGEGGKLYLDESLFTDIKLSYHEAYISNPYSALYNICNNLTDTFNEDVYKHYAVSLI
tara:strand:+ start:397 stop:1035 length:639 start_codon:yes stop_codon:yes gene_type:complete